MEPIRVLLALDRQYGFNREVFTGIADSIHNYTGIFFDIIHPNEHVAAAVAHLRPQGILSDAARWWPIDELVATGLPCVNVANRLTDHLRVPVVGNDDEMIGSMVAEHFLVRGYKHFGFVQLGANAYFRPRGDAFAGAIRKAGLGCEIWPAAESGEQTREACKISVEEWLLRAPKPLGLMCAWDGDARDVVAMCVRAKLRIPEQVSVIGVDNDADLCLTTWPQISSVVTGARQIGRTALKVLLSMIRGESPPPRPILIPPCEIAERGTTGEAAVDDPQVAAAIGFIVKRLRHRMTVRDIAVHLSISRRSLERKFLESFNRTPLQEIRRRRVEHAKRMLINTDMKLAEVARMSGMIHISRLANQLKQSTGLTPVQFRRQFGRTP